MTTIMRMTAVESGPMIRSISLNCDPRKYPAITNTELQTAVPAAEQRKNHAMPLFRRPAGNEIIVLQLGITPATTTTDRTSHPTSRTAVPHDNPHRIKQTTTERHKSKE